MATIPDALAIAVQLDPECRYCSPRQIVNIVETVASGLATFDYDGD